MRPERITRNSAIARLAGSPACQGPIRIGSLAVVRYERMRSVTSSVAPDTVRQHKDIEVCVVSAHTVFWLTPVTRNRRGESTIANHFLPVSRYDLRNSRQTSRFGRSQEGLKWNQNKPWP